MDYELQRCTRCCAQTGRELTSGEPFYSVLLAEAGEMRRYDYSQQAWNGPPEAAIGWWRSLVPTAGSERKHWAPNDVMLEFLEQLAGQADKQDVQYVLALLLVRRRVMRLEETAKDEQGGEVMVLYCPRRETTYRIPAVVPAESRISEIQEELARLLE